MNTIQRPKNVGTVIPGLDHSAVGNLIPVL
jgi:hypothetical protein